MTPRRKSLKKIEKFKTTLSSQSIPKRLQYFFIFTLYFLFMDFGIVTSAPVKFKILFKLSIVIVCFVAISSDLLYISITSTIEYRSWYYKYLPEYLCYIIILLMTPKSQSFYTYLKRLSKADVKLKAETKMFHIDTKILATCIGSFATKCCISIIFCSTSHGCIEPNWIHFLIAIPYFALDYPQILFSIAFHAAFCRLRQLRRLLETTKFKASYYQHVYKYLIDCMEDVKRCFERIYITSSIFNIPFTMFLIYEIIKQVKFDAENPLIVLLELLIPFLSLNDLFAPAIAASTFDSEIKKIKNTLFHVLAKEKDEKHSQEIKRFIRYVDARPFKFFIYKIPLDVSLTVKILSFCFNYIIVLLQITRVL